MERGEMSNELSDVRRCSHIQSTQPLESKWISGEHKNLMRIFEISISSKLNYSTVNFKFETENQIRCP